jgi:hypothetical protein
VWHSRSLGFPARGVSWAPPRKLGA